MRLTASTGSRTVDLRIRGDSPELLAQAEKTALNLLRVMPDEPADEQPDPERQPFGFSLNGISLDAQTERAEPAPDPLDHHAGDDAEDHRP